MAEEISQKMKSIQLNEDKTIVLLVGAAGVGKSSLINSILSVLDSDDDASKSGIKMYVPTSPKEHMGGHTLFRERIDVTEFVTIIDNRGWHDWDNEAALKELTAQINGERRFDDDINWEGNTSSASAAVSEGASFSRSDKAYCVGVVINGEKGTDSLIGLSRLVSTCYKATGRRPLVVVTHRDKMSAENERKVADDLKTRHGITSDRVFFIQNERSPESIDERSTSQLLDFVRYCIADGKCGIAFHNTKVAAKARDEQIAEEQYARDISKHKRERESQEAIEQFQFNCSLLNWTCSNLSKENTN